MNNPKDPRTDLLQRIERNCTPYQFEVFRKVMTAITGVFARERVSLTYFADDTNGAFFNNVERAILESVANVREPQPPTEHPDPVRREPSEEYRPTYWWNND